MSRLTIPTRDEAPAATHAQLDAVQKQLGVVPNLFRLVATSPAALEGMLGLMGGINRTLDAALRARIALAVAQVNGCDYCLSAHAYLAEHVNKLDAAEIARSRQGHAADPRADAAVHFASRVAETRGKVTDADLAAVKLAGFSEAQVIEIVVNVAVNVLTNFVNNVAQTDIDFPVLRAEAA